MVNTPIPHSLKSEAKKAAKILKEFTVPTAKMGPDKLIPGGILLKAKGLAILTVVKAGFLVTARGGSGIVIAKLNDGITSAWSAPTAIGIAGLGGGFEIGAEVTDFVIILNKRSAVEAFSKGGNLTLGGNFTIAAGPLGRNLEADIAVRGQAAIYTYSKTRGIFAGISVEGSGLIERKDANKKFYGRDIRAFEILKGDVAQPEECACLYEVLEMHRKKAEKELVKMAKKKALQVATGELDPKNASRFSSLSNFAGSFSKKSKEKKRRDSQSKKDWDSDDSDSSPGSWRMTPPSSRKSPPVSRKTPPTSKRSPTSGKKVTTTKITKTTAHTVTKSKSGGYLKSSPALRPRSISGTSLSSLENNDIWDLKVTAIYPYDGQLPCDLSFKKGDVIVVTTRTDTQDDWWEGCLHGNNGIFPANYVRINE
ncbi:SH3 domain-containing YSC84-like protein 1 [Mactra antiquata]